MTDKIEPALTAEEWKSGIVPRWKAEWSRQNLPSIIALANAALPEGDPRKITREMVSRVRHAGHYGGHGPPVMTPDKLDALLRIADALESYLPPE